MKNDDILNDSLDDSLDDSLEEKDFMDEIMTIRFDETENENEIHSDDMKPFLKVLGLEEKDLIEIETPDKLLNSYEYTITFVRYINDQEYLYVVKEMDNNDFMVDIHYYVKYYKNGKILIDWELDTYNPYFECNVNLLEWDSDKKEVLIGYFEKHHYCKVKIGLVENQIGHDEYLKSKPSAYSRSMNKIVDERQSRGHVVEFYKNGKKNESKNYW